MESEIYTTSQDLFEAFVSLHYNSVQDEVEKLDIQNGNSLMFYFYPQFKICFLVKTQLNIFRSRYERR